MRVGNEAYARANKSFGATTLRRQEHAEVKGGCAQAASFKAKSGKLREVTITDRRLAHFVRKMQDLPGQHLFQYLGEDSAGPSCRLVRGQRLSERRRWASISPPRTSAPGMRASSRSTCWRGAKGQLTIKALMQEVADKLGNTPAVARRSYVHPAVVSLVDRQANWREGLKLPRKTRWLSRQERGLIIAARGEPAGRSSCWLPLERA